RFSYNCSMKKKIVITVLILLVVAAAGYYVYTKTAPISIPQEVIKENLAKKLTSYLPEWLPGTYQIDKESFSRQEDQVFVYSATDKERNRLFFSQQPLPKNYDF